MSFFKSFLIATVTAGPLLWAQAPEPVPNAQPEKPEPARNPAGFGAKGAPALPATLRPAPSPELDPGDLELQRLKARETGCPRFAQDLFAFRDRQGMATEGGIAEDYALNTGDGLALLWTGDREEQQNAEVDGKGEIAIPSIGSVRVAGLHLAQANRKIQAMVRRQFSGTEVSMKVTKLREVRVFVQGEVYRPGSYLVPSLSSLVNVLSLAGGPNALGSYRAIKLIRGGRIAHTADLYELRSKGTGNFNLSFQNGDTLFVPLALTQVLLEGAFTRVAGLALGKEAEAPEQAPRKAPPVQPRPRADHRIRSEAPDPALRGGETDLEPWVQRWLEEGIAPRLQFELLPQERAADVVRMAGGLLDSAYQQTLTLRRRSPAGVTSVLSLATADPGGLASFQLRAGDLLSALPSREERLNAVTVKGWVRATGRFSRAEGLRVGDMLRRDGQLLKDTFLGRGEIIRTREDGHQEYLAFQVGKALAGDPVENLMLEDRDEIELYRASDLKQPHTVHVTGPMSRPGEFPFYEGMRVADLLFRAGVPARAANERSGELARYRDGKVSQVLRLDLASLLTTESQSPDVLRDDRINPRLEADDRISIFEKPNFRLHRMVRISGEVANPGEYAIDTPEMTLRQLLARAGGPTGDAMIRAGIFLRNPQALDPGGEAAKTSLGLETADPTGQGINEILNRLTETKRHPLSGNLQANPVLHDLSSLHIKRLVVDFDAVLKGESSADLVLEGGDAVFIPRRTASVYVVGETASPFAAYKAEPGLTAGKLLDLAGGLTRNADAANLRLLKGNGRIIDRWVKHESMEPGDVLLVPQKIRRDQNWQENLQALTPLALMYGAITR